MNSITLPDIKELRPSTSNKLSLHKFAKFLDKVLDGVNKNHTCTLYSHFISDYYITIDFTTLKLVIPNNIYDKLKKCKASRDIQYYVIPIMLKFSDDISHANIMIVDNSKRTIELYEPHGSSFIMSENIFDIEYHIRQIISIILNERTHFRFTNVHNKCPIGLQIKQGSVNRQSGHCVAWVLFFIHVKLLNVDKTSEQIIEYFDRYTSKDIDRLIRKYITLVENVSMSLHSKYQQNTYHDLTFTVGEIQNAKRLVKNSVNKYLEDVDANIEMYNGVPFFDVKIPFRKYIKFSKFSFFDELYFRTVEKYFKK